MKVQALIIFMSAVTVPYGSTRILSKDIGLPEHTSIPDSTPDGFGAYPIMEQRDVQDPDRPEDASLCFFLKEKDAESLISCKPRLTRSKFNYNPFGLRFGKRDRRLKPDNDDYRSHRINKPDNDGPRNKLLLPVLLAVRELEGASRGF